MKLFAPLISAIVLAALPALGAQAQETAPDLAKGAEGFAAICLACHNADGNSIIPMYPKVAGQHPQYLVKQLNDFRSGAREEPVMQAFAAALSDEDIRNLSWWSYQQAATPGEAVDAELAREGERIYRGGIPDRKVAACAACHSPTGAGLPSQYPRLAGQHTDYTSKQLTGFRDGTRANNAQMRQVAATLSDREIQALANYIATLH